MIIWQWLWVFPQKIKTPVLVSAFHDQLSGEGVCGHMGSVNLASMWGSSAP